MATAAKTSAPETLPADGLSRWGQFQRFSPVCRETFRRLSMEGRAPQPIRMGIRCTMYRNSDLHRWLADPVNYQADAA